MKTTVGKILQENKWQTATGGQEAGRILCSPDCPVCGGIGYVRYDVPVGDMRFGKILPCPKIPPESSLHHNHGLTASEIRTLDWKSLMDRENLKDGVNAISKVLKRGSGLLYLYGRFGLAKTKLLQIACAKWARSGRGVFYLTTQKEMIDYIRVGFDDDDPQRAVKEREEKYIGFPLLALDEITTERNTEFKVDEFFHIINKRHEAGTEKHLKYITLMAGNIAPNQLDHRIMDRLSDGRNQIVGLTGESYRPMMAWEEPEHDTAPMMQDPRTIEWIG